MPTHKDLTALIDSWHYIAGTSSFDLCADDMLEAIRIAGPGYFALHPTQVADVMADLLKSIGETQPEDERLRLLAAITEIAPGGEGVTLAGVLFGCPVYAWDAPLTNAGADRLGLFVGREVVAVISDA